MKDAVLEAAFRATTYSVETPAESFDLVIDSPHAGFARFLQTLDCREWGVITAHNPGGRIGGGSEENEARNTALVREIRKNGWRFYPTRHRADRGDWPVEAGFCVLDAPLDALRLLASRFSQLAFVHGEGDARPRLYWTGK
ncbi:MAG: DUF3293 domain-containing protein [Candidatus Accumulibacter sp.]|jgi:hypothetical protein|nr:DUF3293 domain-containing protein [Accumulibacter sp.]